MMKAYRMPLKKVVSIVVIVWLVAFAIEFFLNGRVSSDTFLTAVFYSLCALIGQVLVYGYIELRKSAEGTIVDEIVLAFLTLVPFTVYRMSIGYVMTQELLYLLVLCIAIVIGNMIYQENHQRN